MVKLTKMYVILRLYDVVGAVWSLLGTLWFPLRHSVIGRTENIEEGFATVRMETPQIKKLLIRWGILTLKFVTINLLLGSLGDFLLFGPMNEMLNKYFGVDQYDGYGDSEQDPTLMAGGDVDTAEEYA